MTLRGLHRLIMSSRELCNYDPAVRELRNALKLAQDTSTPPQVLESLKKVLRLVELKEEFTVGVTTKDTEACSAIEQATFDHDWATPHAEGKTKWHLQPKMLSGHLEGQFLKSVVSMQNAKRVLDIGMFTGYSALSMAEALPADGEVITVDTEKYLESFTGSLLKASPHSKKIHIHIGPATEFMRQQVKEGKTFDFIFLDAEKSEYEEYMKVAFDEGLLAPRGSVLIDNCYRGGDGYTPDSGNNVTKQLAETIKANKSLHYVLVPMRDGVGMVRRVSDVFGEVPQ